jgi:hypothetical protein
MTDIEKQIYHQVSNQVWAQVSNQVREDLT